VAVGLHEAVALCWEDGGHDVYSALRALVRVMLHMEQQSKSLSHMPTCVSSCVGGMIWGDERRSRARYRAKPAWCANPLSLSLVQVHTVPLTVSAIATWHGQRE